MVACYHIAGADVLGLKSDAQLLLRVVRTHWEIENKVHWVLDIAFRENDGRIREGNGGENFAAHRHIALNLLRREKTSKGSLKGRRKKAGWDDDYLLKVLTGHMRWPFGLTCRRNACIL